MMMMMRAIVLDPDGAKDAQGKFIVRLAEVPQPVVANTQMALVKVHAAALNHRDEFIRQKLYPAIQFGSVLGADGAGTVVDVGDPSLAHWVGKEVLINSAVHWGDNEQTPADMFAILGLLPLPGTLAEYAAVPADLLVPKPPHLSWAEAAAIPLAGLTAWRATITKAQVQQGHNVLVTGIGGGVALFALQFAVALGANVYVTSSSQQKIELAKKLGAKGGVNYTKADWPKALKQMMEGDLDAVVDGAGGEALNTYIKLLKRGGIVSMYGATAGLCDKLNVTIMFLKNVEIRGSTMGSPREFANMVEFINRHQLRPIVDSVRPLAETVTALDTMAIGSQMGKLVLSVL